MIMENEEHQEINGTNHVVDLPRMARCLSYLETKVHRLYRLKSQVCKQEKTIRSFAWILFGLIISNFILGILALETILKGVG